MGEPLLFEQLFLHSLDPILVLRETYIRRKRHVSSYEILIDCQGGTTLVLPHDYWGPYVTTVIPFTAHENLCGNLQELLSTYGGSEKPDGGYHIIIPERSRSMVVWPSAVEPLIHFVEDNLLPATYTDHHYIPERYTYDQKKAMIEFARSNTAIAFDQFQQSILNVEECTDPRLLFMQLRTEIESCSPDDPMLRVLHQRERAFLDEYAGYLFHPFSNRNGLMPLPDLQMKSGLLLRAIFNHLEEFRSFIETHLFDYPEIQGVTFARSSWFPFEFDMEQFLSLPHLEELRYLEFNDCDIGESGLNLLASSSRLGKLEHLAVYHELIGDSLPNILSRANFESLRSLTLFGTSLTFRGLEILFSAPWFSTVTDLYLGDTLLSDPGINALLSYPNLNQLSSLTLSHSNMSTQAVLSLANSPHLNNLRNVNLFGEKLSTEAKHALKRQLGDSVVMY